MWIVAYFNRVRVPRFKPSENPEGLGQGRKGCETDLQPTNWRTRPIFGGSSAPILCRRNDGVPNRMDRIRCLGNSVVPQVAQIFARFIYQCLRPAAIDSKTPEPAPE